MSMPRAKEEEKGESYLPTLIYVGGTLFIGWLGWKSYKSVNSQVDKIKAFIAWFEKNTAIQATKKAGEEAVLLYNDLKDADASWWKNFGSSFLGYLASPSKWFTVQDEPPKPIDFASNIIMSIDENGIDVANAMTGENIAMEYWVGDDFTNGYITNFHGLKNAIEDVLEAGTGEKANLLLEQLRSDLNSNDALVYMQTISEIVALLILSGNFYSFKEGEATIITFLADNYNGQPALKIEEMSYV